MMGMTITGRSLARVCSFELTVEIVLATWGSHLLVNFNLYMK